MYLKNNKLKKILLMVCTALFLLSGCSIGSFEYTDISLAENNDSQRVLENQDLYDLHYGLGSRNVYDLFIPAGLNKEIAQPVILFIHGGGWIKGDKKKMEEDAKFFQSKGYITAEMNYTLMTQNDSSIAEMIREINACLKNIKKVCMNMGICVDECALSGYSAGAHLSLLYAYSMAQESELPVKFVFEMAGPVDMHPSSWKESAASPYLTYFDVFGINEDFIRSISPINYISAGSVPTLMLYAAKDSTIGTLHPSLIEPVLQANNVEYDLLIAPNSTHQFENDPEILNEYYSKALEYCSKYFNLE